MNDTMKIVKSFEESGLLIEGVIQTINNEAKEQKGEFLSMPLGTLGASLLGKQEKAQLEQVKAGLQQVRISNAALSFNKF